VQKHQVEQRSPPPKEDRDRAKTSGKTRKKAATRGTNAGNDGRRQSCDGPTGRWRRTSSWAVREKEMAVPRVS
jgi:hypothetical protein